MQQHLVYRSGAITKADNRHWGREGEHDEYVVRC